MTENSNRDGSVNSGLFRRCGIRSVESSFQGLKLQTNRSRLGHNIGSCSRRLKAGRPEWKVSCNANNGFTARTHIGSLVQVSSRRGRIRRSNTKQTSEHHYDRSAERENLTSIFSLTAEHPRIRHSKEVKARTESIVSTAERSTRCASAKRRKLYFGAYFETLTIAAGRYSFSLSSSFW